MCEELEWLAWQQQADEFASRQKSAQLQKPEKAVAPSQSVEPQTQQEEPVPA